MKKLIYALLRVTAGLLVHPYQTTFDLITGGKKLRWLIFSPMIYFLGLVMLWRLVLRPLVLLFLVASCSLMVLKTSVVFFALFWQLSLIYLTGKFLCTSR